MGALALPWIAGAGAIGRPVWYTQKFFQRELRGQVTEVVSTSVTKLAPHISDRSGSHIPMRESGLAYNVKDAGFLLDG